MTDQSDEAARRQAQILSTLAHAGAVSAGDQVPGVTSGPVPIQDRRPIIVIGGGVGPWAGVYLHQQILRCHPRSGGDEGHLDIWHIGEVAGMPDRTEFLLGRTSRNPADLMAANLAHVAALFASRGRSWILAIPCATFHAPPILNRLDQLLVPISGYLGVVNLIEEAVRALNLRPGDNSRIGVLATTGAVRAGLWSQSLSRSGHEVAALSPASQDRLHSAIYHPEFGLKSALPPSTRAIEIIGDACEELYRSGARRIVLGCTELPLASEYLTRSFAGRLSFLDPIAALSEAIMRRTREPVELCSTVMLDCFAPLAGGVDQVTEETHELR